MLRMTGSRCVLIGVVCAATAGCRGAAPAAGTFTAEVTPVQLAPGQTHEVELTVHYTLPANPATPTIVSYKAQLAAPPGWSADLGGWASGRTVQTTDIGFRDTKKVALTVPGDAPPGEHVVKLTITPEAGPPHTLDLKVQVAAK
jgi:hypothetical protein